MEHIESPEINPCVYSQTLFKRSKNTQWKKDSFFNKWSQENGIFTCKRMKFDPCITPLIKMNSKFTKDLNLRPPTIKLLEKNRKKLHDKGFGNDNFWI